LTDEEKEREEKTGCMRRAALLPRYDSAARIKGGIERMYV